jgi:hypothetical protein
VSPAAIGAAFCAALLANDSTALNSLLTPQLAELAPADTRWHSGDSTPFACMPVGASGTAERPESVLFLTFAGGPTASDRLVLAFVAGELRIDDIAYAGGGTLRASLATP